MYKIHCIYISTLAGCSGKLKVVSGSKSGQLLLMLAEAATSEAKDLKDVLQCLQS